MTFINKASKKDLIEFIDICSSVVSFDRDKFYREAMKSIKYYRGNLETREKLRYLQKLERKWYRSLKLGRPDYSIYNDIYMLSDLWACWVVYSRKYIKAITSKKIIIKGKLNRIVDLGCGIGYTTAALKEIFPTSKIYGTNLSGTLQYKICRKISSKNNFKLISKLKRSKVNLVFASEYFEHFKKPIEHLIEIIRILKPDYFIIANSFNSKSVGHFNRYLHEDNYFNAIKISRLFNRTLRNFKYEKQITKCWNDRPSFWIRRA